MSYDRVLAGGVELEVSSRGSGRPLLLLNGLGARISLFDPLRAELTGHRTITFNQPGIEGSESRESLSMSDYAALAIALLDQLGLHESVDLFGVSWGGCLAQEIAYRYPQRIRRLILASTTSSPFIIAKPAVYRAFMDTRRYRSIEDHRRLAVILYGGRVRENPFILDRIHEQLEPEQSRGRRIQLRAALGWTSLHYAWRLQQPTLVLGGADDPIVRSYNASVLASLIPRAQKHIVPNEGHLFIVTSAALAARVITRFLERECPAVRRTAVLNRARRAKV
jgi:pimeloyl-ACP methyl ester carboxylesterase